MGTIYDVVCDLEATQSSKEKLNILLEASKSVEGLSKFLYYTYNPYYTYGVSFPDEGYVEGRRASNINVTEAFYSLLDKLRNRELTGNAAREAILSFCNEFGEFNAILLACVIEKDLGVGVSVQTINKVWDNLIPTFDIAKASPFEEELVSFPCSVETKMDGVRAIVIIRKGVVSIWSSNGRQTIGTQALEAKILKSLSKNQYVSGTNHNVALVLDGEITSINRRSVSGLFNKALKGTITDDECDKLVYTIFDILPYKVWEQQLESKPYEKRRKDLLSLIQPSEYIKIVDQKLCHSLDDIYESFNSIYNDGGEGVIVKDLSSTYSFTRNTDWLKIKGILDCDLIITGYIEGQGKRAGKVGSLICETKDGNLSVNVGSGLTDTLIDELTKNFKVYQGSIAKVRYNGVIKSKDSDTYSLFLPRLLEIRSDKDEANTTDEVLAQGNIGQL